MTTTDLLPAHARTLTPATGPAAGRTSTGRAVGSCGACGAGIATDGVTAGTAGTCPHCGERVRLTLVHGEHSEMPCDGRCMGAVGPNCSCSCGGANHGRWFLRIELVPVYEREAAQAAQARRRTRHAERAAAKRVSAAERAAAGREQLIADNPILGALLETDWTTGDDYDGFLADMRRALDAGAMSERQIAATIRVLSARVARAERQAKRDAADAEMVARGVRVPTGRHTFTGVIVGCKEEPDPFSYTDRTIYKITIRHADGWRVYGTLPRAAYPEYRDDIRAAFVGWHERIKGQTITLTATIKPSDNDPLFGYFSRPTLPRDARPLSHLGPDGQTAPDAATVAQVTPVATRPRPAKPATPAPDPDVLAAYVAARDMIDRAYRDTRDGRRHVRGSLTDPAATPDDQAGIWTRLDDTAPAARVSAAVRMALALPDDADADAVTRAVKRDRRDADTLARAYLAAYHALDARDARAELSAYTAAHVQQHGGPDAWPAGTVARLGVLSDRAQAAQVAANAAAAAIAPPAVAPAPAPVASLAELVAVHASSLADVVAQFGAPAGCPNHPADQICPACTR